uniref:NAD(P)-binding domain-containing protein n=1 Tax=Bionectria ochroleuca TaxID=29856 RepID=A0A8H7K2B9_BIOOC
MKVIITGSTGLVGSAVIREAIANDSITHAFVLSRKDLPKEIGDSAKVTVIPHADFSTYPEDLLTQLAGCEACIWAIGGRAAQFPDLDTFRKVSVDYTLAAARAFKQHLSPALPDSQRFRFVFCSGMLAEWDQQKTLVFMADTRLVKGQVERGLCDLADKESRFDAFCPRPSGVLPSNVGTLGKLSGKLYGAIQVQDLAKALVNIALNGAEKQIIEAGELTPLHK